MTEELELLHIAHSQPSQLFLMTRGELSHEEKLGGMGVHNVKKRRLKRILAMCVST